jgi:cell division protein FtsW
MDKVLRINFKEKLFQNNHGTPDGFFLLLVLVLSAFGTVMVFSSGYAYAEFRYNDAFYFIKKQAVWLLISLAVLFVATNININIIKRSTPLLYALTLLLLILVLIIGFAGNGAQRWISVGPITIQPSEIAKLTLILALSKYFSDNQEKIATRTVRSTFIYGTVIPFSIILLPVILVMLQHHLSCIIILGVIGVLLIFVSGIDPRFLAAFGAAGICGVSYIAFFTDYTKDRITVWRDPEAYKLTGGWQTLQGLMAIGSGGLFGMGLGNSILKHCYVSEPANDMIFAITCEELGLIGAVCVLFLFSLLIYRGCMIATRSNDTFERLVGIGICLKIGVQVLLNVAVVTNSIPNTGISLPFFSYGGSSLVMLFFEMGLLLSISKKSRIQK